MSKVRANENVLIGIAAPAILPGDPQFGSQWHLRNPVNTGRDLHVTGVWDDYTGRGVVVGIVDTGIDYLHPDLAPNYRHDLDHDARDGDSDSYASEIDDDHGTAVSGMITGRIDGAGSVGVAPDAEITGFRIGFGVAGETQILTQMVNAAGVDVLNNSWGYNGYFFDDFSSSTFAAIGSAIESAVATGRGGLGTVITFSAGNGAADGQNVNYHSFQNSPYTIAVGATDINDALASFSTPGAAVLVSAPGVGVYTTDRLGTDGYASGDYTSISGTSFSSPATAGVIALMLEANPGLGYRDVQEILAYSAREPASPGSGWQTNAATDWNGGGLTVHDGYGFGLVDAHAAVRLAEVWDGPHGFANLASAAQSSAPGRAINSHQTITDDISFSTDLEIDQVQVRLDIDHTWIGDLQVSLTSPGGTTSLLVDRPGYTGFGWGTSQDDIDFTVSSVQYWGESSAGTWTLSVSDRATGDEGVLQSWQLIVTGDLPDDDDTYIYTDDFADAVSSAASSAETADGPGPAGAAALEAGAGILGGASFSGPLVFFDAAADYEAGEVIVKLKTDAGSVEIASAAEAAGATVAASTVASGLQLWQIEGSFADAVAKLAGSELIEYIEPNYTVTIDAIAETTLPNDPSFGSLWGLHNTGQSGGTADADIDAPEAWDIQTGGDVVVGVIDTGVDYGHVDLAANIWTNPGEIAGNGLDDDGNGYVDDIHGWDFVNDDNDPMDDHYHGTHVAGTIAADGNNGTGVTGVSWSADIMALKFLSSSGSGSTFDAIRAVEYATANGAQVTNNSWGGGGYSQSLYNAINAAGQANSLFIAAAGNSSLDTDQIPHYPSNYDLANVISVASTDSTDGRSYFSNYGADSVDLGAPGSSIYSTMPGNGYGTLSGTSMATPHVAGVASLLWANDPTASAAEVKAAILDSVDPISSMSGITVSGGRLNALSALQAGGGGGGSPPPPSPPPAPPPEPPTGGRTLLSDAAGTDTINAAAATGDSAIDLNQGATSTIAGRDFTIEAGTVIENATGGDGDDTLTGNDADNELRGGRGDDRIEGGAGTDTVVYAGNAADYLIVNRDVGSATITDLRADRAGDEGADDVTGVEWAQFADQRVSLEDWNVPPEAADDALATDEDTPVTVSRSALLANDTDPNGDTLTIQSVQGAVGGSVAFSGADDVLFTPDPEFNGSARFTYTVSDPDGETDTATVTVTVAPVNDAPTANDDTLLGNEDMDAIVWAGGTLGLLDNDTDPDGDTLHIASVANALHGTATLTTGGNVRFVAEADYFGTGGFDYTVSDGNGGSATAHVTIELASINDAPTALTLDNLTVHENAIGATVGQVAVSDVDDAAHSFAVSDDRFEVSGGALRLKAGETLDHESESSVAVSVTATDGGGLGITRGFDISVIDDPHEPTAGDDLVTGSARDDLIDADAGDDTIDGGAGDDLILGGQGNDTISGGVGSDALYGGAGDDTYRLGRGDGGDTITDTHQVTETYTYQVPVTTTTWVNVWVSNGKWGGYWRTEARTTTVLEDREGTRTVETDGGADILEFGAGITPADILAGASGNDLVVGIEPAAGGASIASTPTDTATLTDWFDPNKKVETFKFADGASYDVRATVFTAGTDAAETLSGGAGADWIHGLGGADTISGGGGGDVLNGGDGDDRIDGGAGDDRIDGGSGTDTAVYAGSSYDYEVAINGAEVTVRDRNAGDGDEGTDTLTGVERLQFSNGTFAPDALPAPPSAADDSAAGTEDTPLTIDVLANDTDPDGDPLTVAAAADGAHGTTSINGDGTVTYTPDADFSGTDSFTYTITEPAGGSATATVTVDLAAAPDAPRVAGGIGDQSATEDTAFSFAIPAASFVDPDPGEALTYSASLVGGGALPVWLGFDGQTFSGTPSAADLGSLDIEVTARDPGGLLATTRFTLTASERTREPTAGDDVLVGTPEAETIEGLAGNDQIDGRGGDDQLQGGAGDDTYLAARGGGRDTIHDDASSTESYTYFEPVETVETVQIWVSNGKFGGFWRTVSRTTTTLEERQGTRVVQSDAGADAISFGAGIAVGDILVARQADDLVVEIGGPGGTLAAQSADGLTLRDWFNPMNRIETFRFDDGTVVDIGDAVFTGGTAAADFLVGDDGFDWIGGGGGDDEIDGGAGADILAGAAGNDRLHGGAGDDLLFGGAGDDLLSGGAGNDILQGDAGADRLEGGTGDDLYRFGRGDGRDALEDSGSVTETFTWTETTTEMVQVRVWVSNGKWGGFWRVTNELQTVSVEREGTRVVEGDGGDDVLSFGAGISAADILTARAGDNLTVGLRDPGDPAGTVDALDDAVTIEGWFDPFNRIETFRFEGGRDRDVGQTEFVMGGAGGDALNGASGIDWINGGAGDDVLFGGAGDDLFVFGTDAGADRIGDFAAGADRIDLSDFGFASVADDVLANATDTGADTLISLDPGTTILLTGVRRGDIDEDDFLI